MADIVSKLWGFCNTLCYAIFPPMQLITIPPGLASWNETFSVKHLSLAILAIRSGQNLYHPSDSIPLGLANALSRFYVKSSISSEGGWSFFAFLTP